MTECNEQEDNRRETRIEHRAVVIMPYGRDVDMAFEAAELIDCSAHGVCIRTPRPLSPGMGFLIKPKPGSTVLLHYNVKFCRETAGRYEVGGELSDWISPYNESFSREDAFRLLLET
jgi:hypothetical protein